VYKSENSTINEYLESEQKSLKKQTSETEEIIKLMNANGIKSINIFEMGKELQSKQFVKLRDDMIIEYKNSGILNTFKPDDRIINIEKEIENMPTIIECVKGSFICTIIKVDGTKITYTVDTITTFLGFITMAASCGAIIYYRPDIAIEIGKELIKMSIMQN